MSAIVWSFGHSKKGNAKECSNYYTIALNNIVVFIYTLTHYERKFHLLQKLSNKWY